MVEARPGHDEAEVPRLVRVRVRVGVGVGVRVRVRARARARVRDRIRRLLSAHCLRLTSTMTAVVA